MTKTEKVPIVGIFFSKDHFNVLGRVKKIRVGRQTWTTHTFHLSLNYLCTIYEGSKRKSSYLFEKLFEKDLVHLVSDSIFKRLKFDHSSSETNSNQKIKIKNYFHDYCVFLDIRLTYGNKLLPNITRYKRVTAFQIGSNKNETTLVYIWTATSYVANT